MTRSMCFILHWHPRGFWPRSMCHWNPLMQIMMMWDRWIVSLQVQRWSLLKLEVSHSILHAYCVQLSNFGPRAWIPSPTSTSHCSYWIPLSLQLTQKFLHDALHNLNSDSESDSESVADIDLPHIRSKINVYHSAVAVFYAPSDNSGIHRMKRERIRCSPSWYGVPRRDCVLVTIDEDLAGFQGMSAARLLLLFSFTHEQKTYSCALVHWYNTYGRGRDPKTGLWRVKPTFYDQNKRNPCLVVVHLDTLLRGAHLIPVYGAKPVPVHGLHYYHSRCIHSILCKQVCRLPCQWDYILTNFYMTTCLVVATQTWCIIWYKLCMMNLRAVYLIEVSGQYNSV